MDIFEELLLVCDHIYWSSAGQGNCFTASNYSNFSYCVLVFQHRALMQLIKNQFPLLWKCDYMSAPAVLVFRGRNKLKRKGNPDKQQKDEPQLTI